uniref:Mitochondrial carrier protein n=1 Tax=Hemiselmis tepida TaxID=464990 RepID=A0A7S0YV12_9CRYP|mmetsp:Transcript_22640/g.57275  ORF Transcript_22640/g.57275 Transcript_22640/m.57275 type:complete len:277 (+) Transcript_22640:15-845(+)
MPAADLSKLNPAENCVLGITAGCLTKVVNYPLLSWKNTVQQGLPISLNPSVFYRGLPMAVLNLGGSTGVQFGAMGFFAKLLRESGCSQQQTQMGGAFLGGLVSGIPCSLWELTMIQQQRFGGSIGGTPVRVMKEYGTSGLFRGISMTMGRECLFTLAMLGVTPAIQKELSGPTYKMDSNTALAVGALTGSFFAATISHPMDTIKTCMQGDLGQEKYKGVTQTGKTLAEDYGVARGLFKGLAFRIVLIATTFFLVNNFKELLVPNMFPKAVEDDKKK